MYSYRIYQGGVEDFAVVMCGYEKEVRAMLRTCDPGLARRFRAEEAFHFPDYTNAELATSEWTTRSWGGTWSALSAGPSLHVSRPRAPAAVMVGMSAGEGVSVAADVAKAAVDAVLAKQRMKPAFGNAGAVRNPLQTGKARRLARGGDMRRLCGCVVLEPSDFFDVTRADDAQVRSRAGCLSCQGGGVLVLARQVTLPSCRASWRASWAQSPSKTTLPSSRSASRWRRRVPSEPGTHSMCRPSSSPTRSWGRR